MLTIEYPYRTNGQSYCGMFWNFVTGYWIIVIYLTLLKLPPQGAHKNIFLTRFDYLTTLSQKGVVQ